MSTIGIIVKAERDIEDHPQDWFPEILGDRESLKRLIEKVSETSFDGNRIDLRTAGINLHLEVSDDEPPRSITVSGVFGDEELGLLKKLCGELDARFYDSEEGSFVF